MLKQLTPGAKKSKITSSNVCFELMYGYSRSAGIIKKEDMKESM